MRFHPNVTLRANLSPPASVSLHKTGISGVTHSSFVQEQPWSVCHFCRCSSEQGTEGASSTLPGAESHHLSQIEPQLDLKAFYSTNPFIHTQTPLQSCYPPFKASSVIPGSSTHDGHMAVSNLSSARILFFPVPSTAISLLIY